jgi:hypothetical protein
MKPIGFFIVDGELPRLPCITTLSQKKSQALWHLALTYCSRNIFPFDSIQPILQGLIKKICSSGGIFK